MSMTTTISTDLSTQIEQNISKKKRMQMNRNKKKQCKLTNEMENERQQ